MRQATTSLMWLWSSASLAADRSIAVTVHLVGFGTLCRYSVLAVTVSWAVASFVTFGRLGGCGLGAGGTYEELA